MLLWLTAIVCVAYEVIIPAGPSITSVFDNIILRTAAVGIAPGGPATYNERVVIVRDSIAVADETPTSLFTVQLAETNTVLGGLIHYSAFFKQPGVGSQVKSGSVTFSIANITSAEAVQAINQGGPASAIALSDGSLGVEWFVSCGGADNLTVTVGVTCDSSFDVSGELMWEMFLRSDAIGSKVILP